MRQGIQLRPFLNTMSQTTLIFKHLLPFSEACSEQIGHLRWKFSRKQLTTALTSILDVRLGSEFA